ncbi:hypothetical protein [Rhodoferax sp. PAMC 29310]|uniref:hypothetical protein n=1 Tax=Rhodoferax sp. PAMC 29310 TaxID=2822760 RepID=UPI001B32756B|nr:hypothetical protein [Rhodoferax sp. PAMC 29310]
MVISPDIENLLCSIERLIQEVSDALVLGDPQALALASAALRQGAVNFSQIVPRLGSAALKTPSLQLRLKRIVGSLAIRRESLIRQTMVVERSLHTLVPASRAVTYAKASGPYGAPGKSSGTFNVVAT